MHKLDAAVVLRRAAGGEPNSLSLFALYTLHPTPGLCTTELHHCTISDLH
jgi:hypothetical protein